MAPTVEVSSHSSGHSSGHIKGEVAELPVVEVPHSLHKRSLELLLNKLDYKAKKLELKRQKLVKHYALKGHSLKGVTIIEPTVSRILYFFQYRVK